MEEKPLPAQRLDFLRHDSGVRWQKKAPDQQCGQEPSAIGAPSAKLSLVGLRPRRARLRFTRQRHGSQKKVEKQVQDRC